MRNDRLRIQDILDAIEVIERDRPPTRRQFDADTPIKSHIVFHIQVIGEAVSKLSPELRRSHPRVPWKAIAQMRNFIAHVYFGIDWNEVWQTAIQDIPLL